MVAKFSGLEKKLKTVSSFAETRWDVFRIYIWPLFINVRFRQENIYWKILYKIYTMYISMALNFSNLVGKDREYSMSPDSQTELQFVPRHSIAVVSRRTGLTQLVLRAWERRYNVVIPARSATDRRKYTDADVQKLTILKYLTTNGYRIGDVAHLPIAELQALYAENEEANYHLSPQQTDHLSNVHTLLQEALNAVKTLNPRALDAVLNKGLLDLSKPDLRRKLLVPLMTEIGNLWQDGELRVSHEHMATGIVVAFLTSINARYRVPAGAPVLAVATPAGQDHELGALLAAATAFEAGWDVLYLGANIPAEDIAAAMKIRGARAILLSLIYPHGDSATMDELKELRHFLGDDIPMIAGGQAVLSYSQSLAQIGAQVFSSVEGFEEALRDI